MSEIKYPMQVASVKRKNKVLGCEAQLYTPTEKETSICPLEIHSGFSRFVVSIIDNSTEKMQTPTANIPARDVGYIKKMTDIAQQRLVNRETSDNKQVDSLSSSVAYTQKLFDKNYKGKTPAEVLLANPGEKENLIKVRDWLNSNLSRYKGNAAQIKAIDEAIQLLDIGELNQRTTTSPSTITLYSTEYKYKTTKNDRGFNLVYSISIICDPTRNYPFTVNVTNCYAPVVTEADGTKNIKMTEAIDMVKSSFSMSDMEWYQVIDRIDRTLTNFEQMSFIAQFEKAKANSYKHES